MDSLFDLLQNKDFDQPPEIAAIKDYVRKRFKAEVGVALREQTIIIEAKSAALVTRLRYDLPNLQEETGITKRISFRITG
jgi:hypothetical protein